MTIDKASRFASALEALCREHGVMIWTSYETAPMIMSDAAESVPFHYYVELAEITTSSAVLRRALR